MFSVKILKKNIVYYILYIIMSIRFFNVFQSIQRLMSHPTQEYCFLTLKCKMSTKAGASRSDIDIITWERTSCIH